MEEAGNTEGAFNFRKSPYFLENRAEIEEFMRGVPGSRDEYDKELMEFHKVTVRAAGQEQPEGSETTAVVSDDMAASLAASEGSIAS